MKEIKIIAIATLITALIIFSCAYAMPACAENNEVAEIFAVIIDFNYTEDSVDCLDEQGNIWTFYDIDDWIVGDKVMLTVWTCTDEILDIEYLGWWNIFEVSHYVVGVCG